MNDLSQVSTLAGIRQHVNDYCDLRGISRPTWGRLESASINSLCLSLVKDGNDAVLEHLNAAARAAAYLEFCAS